MVKLVNVLVRDEGLSHEEFVEYWFEDHAPLAEELPKLRKYVTSVPTDPERADHDGIVELHFDDMADLSAAMSSDAGERVQADAETFADLDAAPTMIVEETVQLDET